MAFEWLMTQDNLIEVREQIIDRNEDTIAEVVIGTGYGIFRGQTTLEYTSQASASFSHVGTLVFYTPNSTATTIVDGVEYTASHKYPKQNDICVWKGISYVITGIDFRPDVHGEFVGYTIRCSSGR